MEVEVIVSSWVGRHEERSIPISRGRRTSKMASCSFIHISARILVTTAGEIPE